MRSYWPFDAIQKNMMRARIPKTISGKLTAKPIWIHCLNDLPPSPDVAEVTSGTAGLGGKSFVQWLQIGFAVTLPLLIFGALALLIFFWMASKGQ